jgi:uncharacterized coiled-coil DUF342 family protein
MSIKESSLNLIRSKVAALTEQAQEVHEKLVFAKSKHEAEKVFLFLYLFF